MQTIFNEERYFNDTWSLPEEARDLVLAALVSAELPSNALFDTLRRLHEDNQKLKEDVEQLREDKVEMWKKMRYPASRYAHVRKENRELQTQVKSLSKKMEETKGSTVAFIPAKEGRHDYSDRFKRKMVAFLLRHPSVPVNNIGQLLLDVLNMFMEEIDMTKKTFDVPDSRTVRRWMQEIIVDMLRVELEKVRAATQFDVHFDESKRDIRELVAVFVTWWDCQEDTYNSLTLPCAALSGTCTGIAVPHGWSPSLTIHHAKGSLLLAQ
jgi:hypothetical protein